MQRSNRIAQAMLVSAGLLASACDGPLVTALDGGVAPRFQEYQCTSGDSSCEGPGPNPDFFYGSSVTYSSNLHDITTGDDDEASLKGRSWSENRSAYIASATVYAIAYIYPNCSPSNRDQWEVLNKTVYGIGTANVYSRKNYRLPFGHGMGFQMVATHTFTAKPGYTGGATVYSEASRCDGRGSFL